ncbi:hypothetical protein M0638_27030 [Roseomonas sp. NAR14]|uniref:Uncharacterized protein n=1 Tax=Roseomonas acroporae TaxID=2937791 RepID=A0A9X1YF82_9PROT|nr:hypothetical protein [Roseomonas acroporae]MCK8788015.1 hypothetical protein [Roseomonas acroporae]
MAFTVSFGNNGRAEGYSLSIGDGTLQDGAAASSTGGTGGSVGTLVNGAPIAVAGVAGGGTGGSVGVSYDTASNTFDFDVLGSTYNAVKNALVTSDTGAKVALSNFVQVDVSFGGGSDSSVSLANLKRGTIGTGAGNDTVDISLLANNADWQNAVSVSTGAGSDVVTIKNGSAFGGAGVVDGHLTALTIDGGAGNDTIDLSGITAARSASITGGLGNDTLAGSAGGHNTFVYLANVKNGSDTITNFHGDLGDRIALNGMSHTEISLDDGTLVLLGAGGRYGAITLEGVTAVDDHWFI